MQRLQQHHGWSQRRTCRALNQNRSTQRYKRNATPKEDELRFLSDQFPTLGGKKIALIASRKSDAKASALEKQFYRHRFTTRAKKAVVFHPKTKEQAWPLAPNEAWSSDLTQSSLLCGRKIQWLAIIDEYSRYCILLQARQTWTGDKITKAMVKQFGETKAPQTVKLDNARLWKSAPIEALFNAENVTISLSKKASPWENSRIESFFASFHREFLSRLRFTNLSHANIAASQYREFYNEYRPHTSLSENSPLDRFQSNSTPFSTKQPREEQCDIK